MNIILAQVEDASVIHNVMLQAFKEYEHATPPSSALNETIESIEQAMMKKGEHAFIGYIDEQPVAMVRFTLSAQGIYFFRLSVIPEKQGQGLATVLIAELEQFARTKGKRISECKVRMSVPRNIELYRSLGYIVTKESKEENRNGFSLSVATMEKQLTN
ncbi:GNAT family N-acetyltransferase [Lysinibacillus sp. NPDC093216]|uniref:GNAT family N-acetyltransferase n=1 Tax=Lysinibacillus sp. NPDC093216 TaxID=3390576 RepID=UPI003D079318